MNKVLTESINAFSPEEEGHVQPEEQIYVLTGSQLQDIISRAVQPLQDEVSQLKATSLPARMRR